MSNWTRRRFLKGALHGAAIGVGLPILDSMLNGNGVAWASGAPLPTRFGTWFWPCGINAHRFFPDAAGAGYDLKPETQALADLREKVNIFSGFNVHLDGQPNLVHWSGIMGALSGTTPRSGGDGTGASEAHTLDMLVADHFGNSTRFRSLEISCTGQPRVSYSMRAGSTINPTEASPVELYRRLFGPGFSDPNAATFTPDPAIMLQKSVLSAVSEDRRRLMHTVSAADRERLDQYFTSLRGIEERLTLQLKAPEPLAACAIPSSPKVIEPGATWEQTVETHDVMTDLLVMALACNQTRVFHVALSHAVSNLRRTGTPVALHEHTHQEAVDPKLGYQPETTFFLGQTMAVFATLLRKMDAVKEGDRTLLDNSLVLAVSESNWAKLHTVESLPMVVAGRAGGAWRSGLHVKSRGDTTSRVGLTIQQALGMPVGDWGTGANATSESLADVLA